MKNLFLLISVSIFLTIETIAQIPNSGFEIWENYKDDYTHFIYEKPDMWVGSLPKNTAHSFSITKNSENYPSGTGRFSMKIKPDIANGVRGVALSNDMPDSMKNWIPEPSFAINGWPTSLNLFYKYLPSGGDTMLVQVYFYKNGVVIGITSYGETETVTDWTALEIPITYSATDVPDSASILFLTGVYVQHSESVLYVDNLSFNGFSTFLEEINNGDFGFALYPNPSDGLINLNAKNKINDNLILNFYNSAGILVKTEKVNQNQSRININDLDAGMYFIEMKSKDQVRTQKLFIQNK